MAALPQNEDGRTGPANPVRRSMGKLRLFAAFGLQKEKRTAIPVAMRKKKRTAKADRASIHTFRFGFGNGESPGAAHGVSDLSRRFDTGASQ